MTWFLKYNGTKKSFADWQLFNVKRHICNQGTDTLTFQTHAQAPAFDCDTTVEVFFEDTRQFFGRITETPCHLTPTKESKTYVASGPFWFLEHLVYQQSWQYFQDEQGTATTCVPRSRCILGQSDKGEHIDARQCIADILDYAQKHQAPIACGKIDGFDFLFPYETIKDCSCAEALKKVLQWTPDAVVWFDYTTPIPKLNVARSQQLPVSTLPDNACSDLSITPRHDLKLNAVVINYEHTHSNGKGSWKTTTVDAFPKTATGEELNALVLTIELEGTRTHMQEQRVVVEPINSDQVAWWKAHIPALKDIPDAAITLSDVQREQAYPNELVEGAIAPWMRCKAAYETITAIISYQTDTVSVERQVFALKLCSTNAKSKTYRQVIWLNSGTKPPQNLAQILYEGSQCLQFEGSLTLTTEELSQPLLGQRLQIPKNLLREALAPLPVQEEIDDIDNGSAWLRFGAPKQLNPNDLVQLMHTNRTRHIAEDAQMRFAQRASGQTMTYFPHHTPLLNSSNNHGNLSKLMITNKTKGFNLNPEKLPDKTQLEPKLFDVVENGQLKQIWVLSS
jgi:hypothetical protein